MSDFDLFWKEYPRRDGKKKAFQAWEKSKARGELPEIGIILASLEKHKTSKQWTKDEGEFIPLPATWINQARWADELEPEVSAEGENSLMKWARATQAELPEIDVPESVGAERDV